MFNKVFKQIPTRELAEEFNRRTQNNMELAFVNDNLLHSLLEALEAEEQRRIEKDLLTQKIMVWIQKTFRKGTNEISA